jgi:hypothetical protein
LLQLPCGRDTDDATTDNNIVVCHIVST